MSDVNVPLLRKAVEWAEVEAAKPDELCGWYQGSYMRPVLRADGLPVLFPGNQHDQVVKSEEINGCGTAFCIAGWVYYEATGETNYDFETVDTFAQRELGLTQNQAYQLFSGSNSIEEVRVAAERIAGERL